MERFDFSEGRCTWQHNGEDILLANAPRNQLRVLRTEVEDDDCLGGHDFSVAGMRAGCKDGKQNRLSGQVAANLM